MTGDVKNRANRDREAGQRVHPLLELERRLAAGQPTAPPWGNTTLTVVVTNQKLESQSLRQLARQVHSSMACIILPFHTLRDGDVLYAVTTNEVEHPTLSVAGLGMLASGLVWDAALSI